MRKEIDDSEPQIRLPIRASPYEHQVKAYQFALGFYGGGGKGVAYLMDMGTGKTITTIAVAGRMFLDGKVERLLIVCPKSIVGVWEKEFAQFADFDYTLKVLEGGSAKSIEALKKLKGSGLQVVVVNYETCWRIAKDIEKWKPCMIVCDESSKIKNPQTRQSKALHGLGKVAKYNKILTGTPITNGAENFFSQYKFLSPEIFGNSYYSFRARYLTLGGYGGYQVIGYKNMAELTEKAHSVAFRVKLEDAVDLPPYTDITREVELERSAKTVYDAIDQESYTELMAGEITTTNILTRLLRLSQVTGGFIKTDQGESVTQVSAAKLDALDDILDECIEQGKKVVVFARFIPEIEAIEKLLKSKKLGYAIIHGAVKDRAEQVERFQTDPDCKVFIGQLQTTGMGLTLTAASVAVYLSLDYSYANYQQSRARIHRIGQQSKCLYIHLIAKGTIDEKILETLEAKGDIAKLLVDEWRKLKGGGEIIDTS